jgi:hypothetical protein
MEMTRRQGMRDKLSWDDIPSLETAPASKSGSFVEQRSTVRLTTRDIQEVLLNTGQNIRVRIATFDGVLPEKADLEDINHRGMCFVMPGHGLQVNESILIGGIIGERLFKCRAVVRWQSDNRAGVKFLDATAADKSFFKDLSSAKFFKDLL